MGKLHCKVNNDEKQRTAHFVLGAQFRPIVCSKVALRKPNKFILQRSQ
jgi:hypothetical protein